MKTHWYKLVINMSQHTQHVYMGREEGKVFVEI